jgi:hypothetical protein
MDRRLNLALGAAAALFTAVGASAVAIAATGRGMDVAQPPVQPSPAATARPAAARAARAAVVTAEAQVLGMRPQDLAAELGRGTTLHQLAGREGISQAEFQARYTARLTALLDRQVRTAGLTGAQEQQALQRLGTVPNWDRSGQPALELSP